MTVKWSAHHDLNAALHRNAALIETQRKFNDRLSESNSQCYHLQLNDLEENKRYHQQT